MEGRQSGHFPPRSYRGQYVIVLAPLLLLLLVIVLQERRLQNDRFTVAAVVVVVVVVVVVIVFSTENGKNGTSFRKHRARIVAARLYEIL